MTDGSLDHPKPSWTTEPTRFSRLRPARAALEGYGPGEVLTRINQYVNLLHPSVTATCLYAIYAAERRTLTRTSAGHFPTLLARPAIQPGISRPTRPSP